MNRQRLINHFKISPLTFLVITLVVTPAQAAPIPPAAQYVITDLGTLGGDSSTATDINAGGQITGYSRPVIGAAFHAFLWTPTTANGTVGSMLDLETLGGSESSGAGINDSGYVTGTSKIGTDTRQRAFFYDGTTMHDLGVLIGQPDSTLSFGTSVNTQGQVAGTSGTTAFLFDGTSMHTLPTLGGNSSYGNDINIDGQIVGNSSTSGGASHAYLWTPAIPNGNAGTMLDLGTLGGANSSANSINDNGLIAGHSDVAQNDFVNRHAFLYDGTSMHDLGTLDGISSSGQGINGHGHVVGNSGNSAFLWTSSTGMVDLNTLIDPASGWQLSNARGINDAGQIVGSGMINGELRGYLLTPVPEPHSLVLIGLCSVVFSLVFRWQPSRFA